MSRRAISTNAAPGAVGPYSQAIDTGTFVFCSGQVGLDPQTGELAPGGLAGQAERALKNIGLVLDAAGLSYADVVKSTVFLVDFANFATLNEVYGKFFPEPPPARSTVGVAVLPRDALVEVEVIALRREV